MNDIDNEGTPSGITLEEALDVLTALSNGDLRELRIVQEGEFLLHMLSVHLAPGHDQPTVSELNTLFGLPDLSSPFLAALLSAGSNLLDHVDLDTEDYSALPHPADVVLASVFELPDPEHLYLVMAPGKDSHRFEHLISGWERDLGEEMDEVPRVNLLMVLAIIRYWLNSRRGMEETLERVASLTNEVEELSTFLRENAEEYGVPAWARKGSVA